MYSLKLSVEIFNGWVYKSERCVVRRNSGRYSSYGVNIKKKNTHSTPHWILRIFNIRCGNGGHQMTPIISVNKLCLDVTGAAMYLQEDGGENKQHLGNGTIFRRTLQLRFLVVLYVFQWNLLVV